MNKRNNKKHEILWAGLELMQMNGYNGTSVKDIVDAAGVPKGSFYHYFDSKEAFAIEALDAVSLADFETKRAILSNTDTPAIQRLVDYFEQKIDQSCHGEFKVGCFFGKMCQEMADCNETIRHKVHQILARKTQQFITVLKEAQANGELAESAEIETIAEFLLNAWEGTLTRMKAAKTREPLDVFLKMLPQIIQ